MNEDNKEENFEDIVKKQSDQKLCDIIVSSRYLHILKDEAKLCMEELAERRKNGNLFNYEEEIKKGLDELPKYNLDLQKLVDFRKIGFKI